MMAIIECFNNLTFDDDRNANKMATPTAATFSYIDYIVFALSLLLSAAIGVYHGCIGSKQTTTDEFLMGGKNMGVIPVALSMVASFLSAISLLGQPAEMYYYGTQFCFFTFCVIIAFPVAANIFIPIFHGLEVTSAYETGQITFRGRMTCTGVIVFQHVWCVSVTGLPLWASVVSSGVVCTFYTSLGGMKAVIWTDTFQMLVIFVGLLVVIVKASVDIGGIGEVFRISNEGGRLIFFNMDPDPTTRTTFWSMIIGGGFVSLTTYATNQATVQRYLSIRTVKRAK
ncbi:PREDICTED: sodium-dependent multivitamin transporter-like [Priapulus caudatus]|uniref:Sodium-dependent multivitamin transporter-like n=1 Tax=Priapulus caudatus TaxID=37621 RepID=A0ABM1EG48_PRICU|nr:PREDICTED: sodium-dependent multivitamin transporter-like [Priapulus caudatus]